jgi:Uma2 family endonuclease
VSIAVELRQFTVNEYHRMIESGILSEDDRVELIGGEIVQMGPTGSRHAACVKFLNRQLGVLVSDRMIISVQDPIRLDSKSEPEPDVALLKQHPDLYRDALPTASDTLLVVEVAETSLQLDREVKAPLYAGAGIPELWIVDLENQRIEVHRGPTKTGYRDRTIMSAGEQVTVPDGPSLEVTAILGIRQST